MPALLCPGCSRKLNVPDTLSGKKVRCPACSAKLSVPIAGGSTVPPASRPAGETETVPPAPPAGGDSAATVPPADPNATVPPTMGRVVGQSDQRAPADYEVLGELGRGGMGVVYKARHRKLNRLVALKMILSGAHAGEDEMARFATEAEAIARLQHPGIVQVYEVGEHDGRPFFALEFCPGGALDKKLAGTPMQPKDAAKLVQKLAEAMQEAHDAKVIHRDLKPANVLMGADGTPKVTDFGLAKKLDEQGQTVSGAIMGTPSYMAPEQARGEKSIGPAADVYALGAILYECLTGRPPFRAATPFDTIMQVVSEEPVAPRLLNPKVPSDLETVCLKCLSKERGDRYRSAEALAADLRRFRTGEPVQARPIGRMGRLLKWAKRRPAVAAYLGASFLVVMLSVVLAIVLITDRSLKEDELDRLTLVFEANQRQDSNPFGRTNEKRRISDKEDVALGKVSGLSRRGQLRFIERGLARPVVAKRFSELSGELIKATVGENAQRRQELRKLLLARLQVDGADHDSRFACFLLVLAMANDEPSSVKEAVTGLLSREFGYTAWLKPATEKIVADLDEKAANEAARAALEVAIVEDSRLTKAIQTRDLRWRAPPPEVSLARETLLFSLINFDRMDSAVVKELAEEVLVRMQNDRVLSNWIMKFTSRGSPTDQLWSKRAALKLLDKLVLNEETISGRILPVAERADEAGKKEIVDTVLKRMAETWWNPPPRDSYSLSVTVAKLWATGVQPNAATPVNLASRVYDRNLPEPDLHRLLSLARVNSAILAKKHVTWAKEPSSQTATTLLEAMRNPRFSFHRFALSEAISSPGLVQHMDEAVAIRAAQTILDDLGRSDVELSTQHLLLTRVIPRFKPRLDQETGKKAAQAILAALNRLLEGMRDSRDSRFYYPEMAQALLVFSEWVDRSAIGRVVEKLVRDYSEGGESRLEKTIPDLVKRLDSAERVKVGDVVLENMKGTEKSLTLARLVKVLDQIASQMDEPSATRVSSRAVARVLEVADGSNASAEDGRTLWNTLVTLAKRLDVPTAKAVASQILERMSKAQGKSQATTLWTQQAMVFTALSRRIPKGDVATLLADKPLPSAAERELLSDLGRDVRQQFQTREAAIKWYREAPTPQK